MTICKDCYVHMMGVMLFSKNKHKKFERYPKCFDKIKHRKLQDEELDFGEVLDKAIHKRK